jgi:hypothetical protein
MDFAYSQSVKSRLTLKKLGGLGKIYRGFFGHGLGR